MAGFGLQFLNGIGESSDVDVFSEDLENKSADSYIASVEKKVADAKDWQEKNGQWFNEPIDDSKFGVDNWGNETYAGRAILTDNTGRRYVQYYNGGCIPQAYYLDSNTASQPTESKSDSINLSFTMRDAVIFGAGAIAAMIIGKLIK